MLLVIEVMLLAAEVMLLHAEVALLQLGHSHNNCVHDLTKTSTFFQSLKNKDFAVRMVFLLFLPDKGVT